MKGSRARQREDNHKNAKTGSFSQEPDDQIYNHESFLILCRFQFVQIMVPDCLEGQQKGKLFLLMFILGKNI
jgi:hypothetical protein